VECTIEGLSAEVLASGQASVFARVELTVNLPPVPGQVSFAEDSPALISAPRALVDTVGLITSGWTDSADDLPLRYAFFVDTSGLVTPRDGSTMAASQAEIQTILSGSTIRVLRGADLNAELATVLPQGLAVPGGPDVQMTLIATARDPLGAVGLAATHIMVAPALSAEEAGNSSAVTNAAAGQLSKALESASSSDPA